VNKNLKVISSLAMAGILAATGISTVSAATTKSLGVYRKLVEGKTVVPYVLASSDNTITAKNVKEEYGNVTISLADGSIVKTGTTFKKAGEEHTVVIYGDVNADGRVNVNDVTETAKAVFNTPTKVIKEAADVDHDGTINVNDVTTLAKFVVVKGTTLDIQLEKEPVEEVNYDYTVAVNANNIVNNVSIDAVKVVVTPKEAFKEETYTVEVVKEDGKTVVSEIASESFTGNSNEKTHTVTLDFSDTDVKDGNYIVRLKLDTKVVGEVAVEKHTDVSKLKANVVAKRAGSNDVVVSLESAADAKIVKMYCTIGDSADTTIANVVKGTALTVTNNTIPEKLITNGNVKQTAQVLSYVLEDIYGNKVVASVAIPADNATESTTTVEGIAAQASDNKFDITLNKDLSSRKVVVTLYQDGKAVDTIKVTTSTSKVAVADFSAVIKEVGTYTVKAYVAASSTEKQSATVDSAATAENAGKIVVSKLAQVSNVKVDVAKKTITWEDNTNKDVNYTVTILRPTKDELGDYTSEDGETNVADVTVTTIDSTKKTAVLPTVADNTSYKVEVVATPKTASSRVLDSEGATSSSFFTVAVPTTPTVDSTSLEKAVKLTGIQKAKLIGDKNATINYAVEVYKVEANETVLVSTKPVTITKTEGQSTYEAVVNGLEAGKSYKFVLAVTMNGVTAKSAITATATTIAKEAIAISGLTVNTAATEAKQGEIKVDGTAAYINGESIANIDVFSTEYQALLTDIVAGLKTGDKVTISGNNVTVVLGGNSSASTDFGDAIEGKTVEITGNKYYRTITTSAAKKAEKVVLNTGCFSIGTALQAKEVVLNGTNLLSTVGDYTVKANQNVTLNGVVTKVSKDTKVTPTTGTLTVGASDSNLEFNTNADLDIAISGEDGLELQQRGSITIASKGGNITLTSPKAAVVGNINVTIENGTLDVTEATLKGAKNIVVNNVKNDTTTEATVVTANLKAVAPITTSKAVKVKAILDAYDAETEELTAVDGVTVGTGKTGKEVVDFVRGLGISEAADASIEVSATGVITLTFNGNVTNYTVPSLK